MVVVLLGAAFLVAGVVVLPVLAHALIEPIPHHSSRRLRLGLIATAINVSTAATGAFLIHLALTP